MTDRILLGMIAWLWFALACVVSWRLIFREERKRVVSIGKLKRDNQYYLKKQWRAHDKMIRKVKHLEHEIQVNLAEIGAKRYYLRYKKWTRARVKREYFENVRHGGRGK